MSGTVLGLILLVILIIFGVPIAFSFGILALFLVLYFHMDPCFLIPTAFYKLKIVVLLAIPFFILIGSLMSASGLSNRLIELADTVLGWSRGALGAATVIACAMFGAIGGTCSAAVAAVGTIMIPRMEERGYPRGYSTALVACSSILGQLIPPSVPMILFALVTLQSVPGCWAATVGPGIIVVVNYSIINYLMSRKMPTTPPHGAISTREKVRGIAYAIRGAWSPMLLAVIILGGVYGGVFTPCESAVVGSVFIIILILVQKLLLPKELGGAIIESGTISGVLMIMLFFIMICSRIFTLEMIPQKMSAALLQITTNKYLILLLVNLFLLIMGMLMDDNSGSLLAGALLLPIMNSVGIHPLHFAAIVGVNLGLGNVTPPCAPILYFAGHIGHCGVEDYFKPAMILMWGGMLPIVLVTTYWPGLSLFLPGLLGYVH